MYKEKETYFDMAKKNSWIEDLLLAAGLIGGAWLTIEALKAASKEKDFYSCPKCNTDIVYAETPCHNCGTELDWTQKAN